MNQEMPRIEDNFPVFDQAMADRSAVQALQAPHGRRPQRDPMEDRVEQELNEPYLTPYARRLRANEIMVLQRSHETESKVCRRAHPINLDF